MSRKIFKIVEGLNKYTLGLWLINDSDSHPLWNQYIASLVTLESFDDDPTPPIKYFEKATHEFLVHALNPQGGVFSPIDHHEDITKHFLTPANFAYQLEMVNDAAAIDRIDSVLKNAVSMDTDFRSSWWDDVFSDSYSLLKGSGPKRKV